MHINVSSGIVTYKTQEVNGSKKILILGGASSNYKTREIIKFNSKEDALSVYGQSELYEAYSLLIDLGITNVYTCNCFAESDYIRLMDKLIHYDFDYLIPIGIYLSDKFYNPITDKNEYYISYFLEQLALVDSLTTIITTERHASLYEDFDSYTISMSNIENEFFSSYVFDKKALLEKYGNNINFVYNNLKDIPYANIVVGALYCTRNYSSYFNSLKDIDVVFNIDSIDVKGLRAMYFKYNYYNNDITLENPFNFKNTTDIYSNALIDDVIKTTIRTIDLSTYKGKLFNPYISMQIENELNKKLKALKGSLFKKYEIEQIAFKKTDPTAGYIIAKYNIIPYGTLETINIIMGVV